MGLPGGFTTGIGPQPDTHDGWKGPMRKRRKRRKDEDLKQKLHDKYYLPANVVLQGEFIDEDEEFLELFMLWEDI